MDEKRTRALTIISVCLAVAFTVVCYWFATSRDTASQPISLAYETALFNGDVIEIDILASDETWQYILDHATDEEYVPVDVVVNGQVFRQVGIRPKGNSSLRTVAASPDTDRYSFRIKFDEYITGQTCFGLDVIVLNNSMNDDTYMREYISYDMMDYLGVDGPLYGYSMVTLNGEDWGLYLALEAYNQSFMQRTYGSTDGFLYSAKANDIAGGMAEQMQPVGAQQPDAMARPGGGMDARGMMGMGGMMGFGDNGLDLVYVGDDPDDYSGLLSNCVGDSATEADNARVISAIEALNEGDDLEAYWDVDQILRYLAVHTVTVNWDSYSTSMCQNYFVYEEDGFIDILPWDYNGTFGAMRTRDADSVINFPIDTPVSDVAMADRPLIDVLLQDEERLEQYHEYLQQIVDEYLGHGYAYDKVAEIDTLIGEYVRHDPTAFCTYEEYVAAKDAFAQILTLRGESIQGQLNGSVPSTTEGQAAQPSLLVSGANIDFAALANDAMMGGGMAAMPPGMDQLPSDMQTMQKARAIIGDTELSQLSEAQESELEALGLGPDALLSLQRMAGMMAPGNRAGGGMGNVPAGGPNDMPPSTEQTLPVVADPNLVTIGVALLSLVALTVGCLFVTRYRRRVI